MNLSTLFRDLSYGELSNLALANDGAGSIVENKQPKLVMYINDALLQLYTRYILKESEIIILMNSWTTNYHLLPRFATQFVAMTEDEDEHIRYILDLPKEKFEGGVLKVLKVFDSNGDRLPLNDEDADDSLYTPQANVLQVSCPEEDKTLSVIFQAAHATVTGELDQDIALPIVLHEALKSYVAYKVYSHMNGEGSSAKAQEHFMMFESICSNVSDKDLVNGSISTTNTRFAKGGWV